MDRRQILHVLPIDLWRGASTYGRALVDHLNGPGQRAGERHVGMTIFGSPGGPFEADVELDLPTGLRRFRLDPRVPPRLARAIAEIDPVLVVAHGAEAMKYLALTRRRRPVVWYRIGVAETFLDRRASLVLLRFCARRADLVACVSQDVADEVAAHGSAPVRVVPNGRDPAAYRIPRTAGDRVRLLFVSALAEGKGPARFLDAVAALRQRGVDVDARMVGDGALRALVERRAAAEGVELLGERTDVPELLASADVFVFSGTGPEGMPGVLIEAALAGLPVVTTAVHGASDVVVDGTTGFVVAVGDQEALVDRLATLVADPALRKRFGDAGAAWCAEHHGIDGSARVWCEVIDGLVGPPPAADGAPS